MSSPAYLQSKQSTWQTPEWLLERVRAVGPIGLDPATTPENPTKARRFYTPADDGLKQPWEVADGEIVFVNPPYARGETSVWADRIVQAQGPVIALVPAWTGTAWCQHLLRHMHMACFLARRVAFVDPAAGREVKGNTIGSIVFARDVQGMRFFDAFGPLGRVVSL